MRFVKCLQLCSGTSDVQQIQVATLALCLLAGCYSHAGDIITAIGEQEVTVDMLTELDRLVQLLESPIFTFVRMEVSSVSRCHDVTRRDG